jgi:hypothetical protein
LTALGSLSDIQVQVGDLKGALEGYQTVLRLAKPTGMKWYSALALMHIARLFRLMKDYDNAGLKLRDGIDVVLTFENKRMQTQFLLEAALLLQEHGLSEQAAKYVGLLQENKRLSSVPT